jgi:L-ascorbate metabolism protein UlaG (beta-lactamase superfamily)
MFKAVGHACSYIKWMDFKARFYDPYLNRHLSFAPFG